MGELLMETDHLSEQAKEKELEDTIILETKPEEIIKLENKQEDKIILETNPRKKIKVKMERFHHKSNKKTQIKVDRLNIILIFLLTILILVILYGIISMKSTMGLTKEQKWEYKTITVTPSTKNNRMGTGAGDFSLVEQSDEQLNQLGGDDWELVSSYLEMETAYANLGNQKYTSGLQPNIRPQDVVLLFKRPIKSK